MFSLLFSLNINIFFIGCKYCKYMLLNTNMFCWIQIYSIEFKYIFLNVKYFSLNVNIISLNTKIQFYHK